MTEVKERSLPQFGPYRCEAVLGTGGMGTVYLASRVDGQFTQKVAIKMLSAHALGYEALEQRLRDERQILAGLNHPNITRLLDGGATPDGALYMVMEYVEGKNFLEYCVGRELDLRSRLGLFREICGAVAYAHRNLVVHRDLKPSNILVTADGQPKLLDFGIAKIVVGGEATTTMAMGTPRYASPEQLRNQGVTTASDIFSLGVILYELVAGRWPFGDTASMVDTWRRATQDVDPAPLPSRQGFADLAVILNKSLAAKPEDRYRSVDDFSEDLRRYLFGEPVMARPQTVWYRVARFAGRYKVAVTAATLAVLSLLGATIVSVRQANFAEREAQRARKLAQFTTDTMLAARPVQGSEPTIRDLLDSAAERVARDFGDDPSSEAEMRGTLGRVYAGLQVWDKAAEQLDKGLEKAQGEVRGKILHEMGNLRAGRGNPDIGRKLLQEAAGILKNDFQLQIDLAALSGPAAEALYRKAAASVGRQDLRWAIAMTHVGALRMASGDLGQAAAILGETTATLRMAPGKPPEVVPALMALAKLRRIQGNAAAASRLLEEALRHNRGRSQVERELRYVRVLEGQGIEVLPDALRDGQNLVAGLALTRGGKAAQGEPLLRLAVESAANPVEKAECLTALAECLENLAKGDQARSARGLALAIYRTAFGEFSEQYPAVVALSRRP